MLPPGAMRLSGRAERWLPYLPALLWGGLLILVGTRTQLPGPPLTGHLDKVAHFGAYAVLGALLGFGWLRAGRRPAAGLLIALAVMTGAVDELLQGTIAGRHGDPLDWLADSAGALTGFIAVARLWGARFGRRGE
jgi:VanZ family protein